MGLKKKSASDCYRHAIRRARERYQVFFTLTEIDNMSQRIRSRAKGCVHLKFESNTRSHWLIDDQFIVVYNRNLHAITTFLPPESIYSYLS